MKTRRRNSSKKEKIKPKRFSLDQRSGSLKCFPSRAQLNLLLNLTSLLILTFPLSLVLPWLNLAVLKVCCRALTFCWFLILSLDGSTVLFKQVNRMFVQLVVVDFPLSWKDCSLWRRAPKSNQINNKLFKDHLFWEFFISRLRTIWTRHGQHNNSDGLESVLGNFQKKKLDLGIKQSFSYL